jgi:transposase
MSERMSRRYPVDLRERSVRMVADIRGDYESEWAALRQVATLLGVGMAETVRKWVRRAEIDAANAGLVANDVSTGTPAAAQRSHHTA